MDPRRLGAFRLVKPLPAASAHHRLFLVTPEDSSAADGELYVAKLCFLSEDPAAQLIADQLTHESKLLSSFNHPGIPAVHAYGEQDGVRYMIMDYIDGVNLASLLGHDRGHPRPLRKELAVYITAQVADALLYIHQLEILDEEDKVQGLAVIHRDVCPSNILLSRDGDVFLADFGTALSGWMAPQIEAVQAGTTAYMAPERVVGSAGASVQSDVFSLAVVLWEMLRGERCFAEDSEVKIIDAISRFDINHPARRVPGLSSKLGEVVRKNLDRDPARRYPDTYQMLQRLAQAPEAKLAEQARFALAVEVEQHLQNQARS